MRRRVCRGWWKGKYAILVGLVVVGAVLGGTAIATAKSLYVVADTNSSASPIQAYDIQGSSVVYQYEVNLNAGWGSVGITVDTDSATLFMTQEGYNTIRIVDAETLLSLGTVTAPGASNLAGIVVDQGAQRVYAVDRGQNKLYVYTWNAGTQTLTPDPSSPYTLANMGTGSSGGAYGLALDEGNDILYVSTNTTTIYYYSTSGYSYLGTFTVSHNAVGIAVDAQRGYLYAGGYFTGGSGTDYFLSRSDLDDFSEENISAGAVVIGVAVDTSTGLVYTTTNADDVRVYDCSSVPFQLEYSDSSNLGDLGKDPAGLCVPGKDISYNPLHFTKEDDTGEGCVGSGDEFSYILCFDNLNNPAAVTNVSVVDYLPDEVTFVSATGGGTYEASTHTITWDIGTLSGYNSGACVEVTVELTGQVSGDSYVLNQATIDSDQTPPTTRSLETSVCAFPVGELYIYPNPCDDDSCTQVTIVGVPSGEQLNIYTISGELVRELTAGGGNTAVWDLRTSDGSLVKRGTYICYALATGAIGKFAIK